MNYAKRRLLIVFLSDKKRLIIGFLVILHFANIVTPANFRYSKSKTDSISIYRKGICVFPLHSFITQLIKTFLPNKFDETLLNLFVLLLR